MTNFLRILPLLFSFLAYSCTPLQTVDIDQPNEDFSKRFGSQIETIKAARVPQGDIPGKQVMYSAAPTPDQIARETAGDYYPYVDITKFGERIPQSYLPTAEYYGQARANDPSNALPQNIFDITYNTALYPQFRRIGAEFDVIKIPPQDAYGVQTAMSDKTYLLPGRAAMMKAVDLIEDEKTAQDSEIGVILVAEKKQIIRKKKARKIFGESEDELAEEKDVKTKEKSKEESKAETKVSQAKQNANAESGFSIRTVKN